MWRQVPRRRVRPRPPATRRCHRRSPSPRGRWQICDCITPPAHGRVEIVDAVFGEQVQAGQRLAVLEHGARPRLPDQELRRSWVKAWLRG